MDPVLRQRARTAYVRLLNFLHRPLVRRGADDPYHAAFGEYLRLAAGLSSPAVLEIGARNVTGVTRRHLFPGFGEYVGFDILPGDGVDVVGDAHRLSHYFPANRFDLCYSVSVFEHLLLPWKAALEINMVLKPGGYLFLSTHPVWPPHELPWDFWRYPASGFHALFNRHTGFEIVCLTEGLPCRTYSLVDDRPTRDICLQGMSQGVALIARKTGEYRRDLLKWEIDPTEVVDSMYPDRSPPG